MENTILKKTIIRKFDSYSDFLSHVVKNTDHNGDKYLDHMVQEYLEKTNYKFDKTTNELYDETNEIDLRNILVPGNTYYSPLWGYVKFKCIPGGIDSDMTDLWFEPVANYSPNKLSGVFSCKYNGKIQVGSIIGPVENGACKFVRYIYSDEMIVFPDKNKQWSEVL